MSLYLLRLGELTLKKGTKPFFERKLKDNLKKRLKGKIEKFEMQDGRYYLAVADSNDEIAEQVLNTTFGLVDSHKCLQTVKEEDAIAETVLQVTQELLTNNKELKSFCIKAKRTDKSFPLTSYQLMANLGGMVLDAHPHLKVDVHNPDFTIHIEIRHKAFVYGELAVYTRGGGGLPTGTAGRGLLLLSGGLDSPVAGYMMMKRGLFLSAVHFYTPPYTSEEALNKAKKLAKLLAQWNVGFIDFYALNFTALQLKINALPQKEYATLLGRACMTLIARGIAQKIGAGCLITGEALSQVASQTLENLFFTNTMADTLVLRPCIGMDKHEIVALNRQMGAFEIASTPEADCCSLFAPCHPIIHANFEEAKAIFDSSSFLPLIEEAVATASFEKIVEKV